MRKLITSTLLLLVVACATVPTDFEQRPSRSWAQPEQTTLGQFFSNHPESGDGRSGVFLLDKPGDAYRARLGLADLAERTLDLQYYLWKGDLAGNLLLHRALQAADRGVIVRLLIDDIYHSGRDKDYAALDSHPNMQVRVFNPIGNRKAGRNLNFVLNKRKLNHRMHNKIFLADGAAGILGGRNIGNDYFGLSQQLNFRDLDVLVVGPAAAETGTAYDRYWNSEAAVPIQVLHKHPAGPIDLEALRTKLDHFLEQAGAMPYAVPVKFEEVESVLGQLREQLTWAEAQIVVDPLKRFEGGAPSAFTGLWKDLVSKANNEIVIQSAYLIPAPAGIDTIAQLTERGVRVRLLTNSLMSNNHITVHSHYAKYRKRLLAAGAELHELRADAAYSRFLKVDQNLSGNAHAGLHTKSAVIDGRTAMIGSFNMDPRSRDLNSEIALLIRSEKFSEIVLKSMAADFEPANSFRVTIDEDGKVQWQGEIDSGPVTFHHEPGASIWKRMGSKLLRLLPFEGEL